jgi:hypothetical protein
MVFSVFAVAAAYVAGTVSPAVGRKIKAFFQKEEAAVKADVSKNIVAGVKKAL